MTKAEPKPKVCEWIPERLTSDYYWISGEGHAKSLMPESGECPYCGGKITIKRDKR
jgi:hypothetical protein